MLQTFPVLALHMLFSWYEAAQFRALSWLQLRGTRVGLRQLVGLHLLMALCTKEHMVFMFHIDGHGFMSLFSHYLI